MSCNVGHRCGSDPTVLWLWCRLAAAAPIQPPAWEPPYAVSTALKITKKKKKKKKKLFLVYLKFGSYPVPWVLLARSGARTWDSTHTFREVQGGAVARLQAH